MHDVGSGGDGDTTRVDEVVRRSLERGEGHFGRERRRGGWSQATVTYEPKSRRPGERASCASRGGRTVPIVNADAARWSNVSMPAHGFKARFSQGTKEHTGHECQNAVSKANQHEGRISQKQSSH